MLKHILPCLVIVSGVEWLKSDVENVVCYGVMVLCCYAVVYAVVVNVVCGMYTEVIVSFGMQMSVVVRAGS